MVESSKLYQLEIAFQNAHYSRVWQSHIYLIASVCYKEAVVFEEEMSQLRQVCCLRAAFKWASECWRAVWASWRGTTQSEGTARINVGVPAPWPVLLNWQRL